MTFFTSIATAVTAQGRINIEASGAGEGRVRLVLSANLGPVEDNASDEIKQVHALMTRPLVATGTPEELEAALSAKLASLSAVVAEGTATLEALRQIREQASSKAVTAPAPAATPAATAPAPAEDASEDEREPATSPVEAEDIPFSIGDHF
ncbi:PRTRC system protein E [Pseudomonas sp. MAG002Y]|uniref:PRTRC system protein E n=1 Tax=Pseudomonas sp. MAG002Y TaxID=2678690 RepID=UPI001C609D6C|nr:PRTRC system protein E [Pseudomonas sp. MAG002Y]MBW5415870.1 PRTRC system protein E [Pseudomonas sp. MAG002Y]